MPRDAVAVVGLGGVLPGARDLEEFHAAVVAGRSAARSIPPGRWVLDPEAIRSPDPAAPDRVLSTRACTVEGFRFDPAGLDLAPGLVARLDPSVLFALHAGREAFLAGRTEDLDRARIGVFLGNIALPTDAASAATEAILCTLLEERVGGAAAPGPPAPDPLAYAVAALPGGLLARALGLGGGAVTIDAACASSLHAVKYAVDALLDGRLDAALAGGLSRPSSLYTQMGFSRLRALSPRGTCAPFDAEGDGLVVGEGAGVVLLKRLEDARRHGDRVLAILRGIGLANDLRGSLLAPDSEGQGRAMAAAYRVAGWSPDMVDHFECHATGTPVGDAVEVRSLRALRGHGAPPAVIGAVKSNVGHLLTGAGAAGLLKTVLAMRDGVFPPTANFRRPAPGGGLEGSGLEVLREARPWQRRGPGVPRRAAVSAFGFGGINAHLLVEEPLDPPVAVAFPAAVPSPGADDGEASAAAPASRGAARPAVAVVALAARTGAGAMPGTLGSVLLGGAAPPDPVPPTRWWGAAESPWFRAAWPAAAAARGRFLDGIAVAAGRFRIPPREVEEMLPQQALMLAVADAALKAARVDTSREAPRAGVFVGMELDPHATDFHARWALAARARRAGLSPAEADLAADAVGPALTANRTMGALGGIVASRLARAFRFGGPCHALQADEASGPRALDAAARALRAGEIDLALVGAVDLAGDPRAALRGPAVAAAAGAPDGAGGPAPADGAVALVLRRLEDALRDGDDVLAVVAGTGAGSGPAAEAAERALRRALADGDVTAASVGLVEIPGVDAASPGDGAATALRRVFGAGPRRAPVHLAAAGRETGRPGAAAGAVSLARAVLALHAGMIPAARDPGGPAGLDPDRFLLADGPRPWLRDRRPADGVAEPRRAAVLALSGEGNAAAVVLESRESATAARAAPPPRVRGAVPLPLREALFVVDGDDGDELTAAGAALRALVLEADPRTPPETMALRWAERRPADPRRALAVAVVAGDRATLLAALDRGLAAAREGRRPAAGGPPAGERVFHAPEPLGGGTAIVFPGSGNHFPGMGRDLFAAFPGVLHATDALTETLRSQWAPSVAWDAATAAAMDRDPRLLILSQVSLKVAVADLLRAAGLRPDAMLGYSLGETAGLFASGAWTDRDGMLRRVMESPLFTRELAGPCDAARRAWRLPPEVPVEWAVGVVDRGPAAVRAALRRRRRAYLLIVNAADECVIGGDRGEVEAAVAAMGATFHPVRGVTTVHCEVAREVEDAYHALHLFPTRAPEGVRLYSAALGGAYEVYRESAAASITGQAVDSVDFRRAVLAAWEDGVRVFVETGPGASCTRMIGRILGARPHAARAVCVAGQDGPGALLRALAMLVAERVPVDPAAILADARDGGGAAASGPDAVDDGATVVLRPGAPPFAAPGGEAGAALRRALSAGAGERGTAAAEGEAPAPVAAGASAAEAVPASPAACGVEIRERASGVTVPVDRPRPAAAAGSECPSPAVVAGPVAAAHAAFLRFSGATLAAMAANAALQDRLAAALGTAGRGGRVGRRADAADGRAAPVAAVARAAVAGPAIGPASGAEADGDAAAAVPRSLHRAACLAFARGRVADVLGPLYAAVDAHPTRVRLPDEPLMLVDRILAVEGAPLSLGPGRVVTEHDVAPGAWYLDGGRLPTCIAVEAGQADLFLSGFLGIDGVTRGLAVYRLLDAVVTFHAPLPGPGAVVRYDIRIDGFFRQGETHLFRFRFDATVDGRPLLSMREGCAGFFTAEELAAGRGIVRPAIADRAPAAAAERPWLPLDGAGEEALDAARVDALRRGDLAGAFGEAFRALAVRRPAPLPGGRMTLIHRVTRLDPRGGRHGLGLVRAEADVRPDDWYLTCHFVDDRVMPGTLMYECSLHALRVLLTRLGWTGEEGAVAWEPVPGVAGRLRCRGQVTEATRVVAYEVVVRRLGYGPEPYAIADALMYADGRPVVEMTDMSLRLAGATEASVRAAWRPPPATAAALPDATTPEEEWYGPERIRAFAVGRPSDAFGEPYRPFDAGRVIARLPGPPYQFLDRARAVDAAPWAMRAGGTVEAAYDVPPDAWYFAEARSSRMPFAVLLEVALQPCGWFAAYMGSALTSPVDLRFRNLGGEAVRHRAVTRDSGTLRTRIRCTSVSASGGMILQHYAMEVRDGRGPVYEGTTYFGFFSAEALANQVGIRGARPWTPEDAPAPPGPVPFPDAPPFPGPVLRMVDRVDRVLPRGGPAGLGWIRCTATVDPGAWFFAAHFHQDPVWPGSLGLESLLQALMVLAHERWGGGAAANFDGPVDGARHAWTYRGQILPTDRRVTVEAAVTAVDEAARTLVADGHLSVDGRIIYEMRGFSLTMA